MTRCEAIARLSDAEIDAVSRHVTATPGLEVTVIEGPTVGMIMARAIEGAHGEVFNLGEVLVTECHVRVGGHDGWCMLQGSRPDAALGGAIIDAAAANGIGPVMDLDRQVRDFVAGHDAALDAAEARLAATRVQFETQ